MTIQELLNAAQNLSVSDQIRLASQLMQTAAQTLEASSNNVLSQPTHKKDPLVGLFSGSPDLADQSKKALSEEIQTASGFTWKG